MKVGITGASGMLGSELVTHLSKLYMVFATSRRKGLEGKNVKWDCFDLTNATLLNQWLESFQPDVIIHCAAIVDVDWCEENADSADSLHVEATEEIANYANSSGARLIYISTDSVFDGRKSIPYSESDTTNPLNVYARTKLVGESLVRSIDKSTVLRTNIIGWNTLGKESFFEWLLKGLSNGRPLNLFYDVCFSPITVTDLALIIVSVIEGRIYGLYNCSSSDSISKYDFGKKVAEIFQLPDLTINKISVNVVSFMAERPRNMALDSGKLSKELKHDAPSIVDVITRLKRQYDAHFENF